MVVTVGNPSFGPATRIDFLVVKDWLVMTAGKGCAQRAEERSRKFFAGARLAES